MNCSRDDIHRSRMHTSASKFVTNQRLNMCRIVYKDCATGWCVHRRWDCGEMALFKSLCRSNSAEIAIKCSNFLHPKPICTIPIHISYLKDGITTSSCPSDLGMRSRCREQLTSLRLKIVTFQHVFHKTSCKRHCQGMGWTTRLWTIFFEIRSLVRPQLRELKY